MLGVHPPLLREGLEELEQNGPLDLLLTMLEEEGEDQEILLLWVRGVLEAVEMDKQHQLVLLLVLPTEEEGEEAPTTLSLLILLLLLEGPGLLLLDILQLN